MPTTGTWTVATGPQPPPTISSIDPPSARPGDEVTIAGTNFLPGVTVTFGGVASPTVTLVDAGSLMTVVPVLAAGPAPVVVKNPDGKSSDAKDFTLLPLPLFIRGDGNMDRSVDIADAVAILFHLFAGEPAKCVAAMDVNSDGMVDLTDATSLLRFLFLGDAPPEAPFPDPGPYGDGPSGLGCNEGLPAA